MSKASSARFRPKRRPIRSDKPPNKKDKAMANDRQFCTFLVDGLYLGIEVLQVQEVIRFQEMTRVPLASPVIKGLINLRGQIVTAIDLRQRLELADLPEGSLPMNVVVLTND